MGISCLSCFASTIGLVAAAAFTAPPSPAALPSAAPLLGKVDKESPNSTLPFSLPVTIDPSLRNVPDPWEVPIFGTSLTIEWSDYRAPLPVFDAQHCVRAATEDAAIRTWSGGWDTPMASIPYSYSEGRVELWLQVEPGETLIWSHWSEVLLFFPDYLTANSWRGAQFVIRWKRFGVTKMIAFGYLLSA